MSGVVSRHTDEHPVGLTRISGVLDAGEGPEVARVVSPVFFFRPGTVSCRDVDPAGSVDLAVPTVAELAFYASSEPGPAGAAANRVQNRAARARRDGRNAARRPS
jgi:hypothetical protein